MTRSAARDSVAPSVPTPRWPWLLAAAVALAIAGGAALDRRASGGARYDPVETQPGFGPKTFAEAVARAQRDVAAARASYEFAPGEWLRGEALARALVARWRLSGDYADMAEAERLLDAALAATPDPAGPVLSKAGLAVALHRLEQADAALARAGRSVAPTAEELADAATLAGDIALQRGQLSRAEGLSARARRIAAAPGDDLRSAALLAHRGEHPQAKAALERAIAEPRRQPAVLANAMLLRASLSLQTGDWVDAGRWIGAAQRAFPGWWLADAYAAQQLALAGRAEQAIRAYELVAARSARPEVMDALAHLLRLQGRARESRQWAARAASRWAAIGARFPEAVAHHRAEHELAVGSAARALDLAQADAAGRPQAPNLVLLARALVAAGRPREALAQLDRADAQGWVSANQLMARSDAAAALGDAEASEAARAKAEAINPRAADPRARLIWFGHD